MDSVLMARDSMRFIQDSIQHEVNTTPDSMRHGFFHAERFNSTFHMQCEGDLTYIFQKFAAISSFQGSWVINHKILIGAKFGIVSTPVQINKYINSLDTVNGTVANPVRPVNMNTMIVIGYIARAGRKVSIEPSLGLGWSYFSFTDPKVGWIDPTETKYTNFTASYFIANPALSVIWNATKYYRIGAVLGANAVFGTDYLRLKSYRIGGPYLGVFMRFGTF